MIASFEVQQPGLEHGEKENNEMRSVKEKMKKRPSGQRNHEMAKK